MRIMNFEHVLIISEFYFLKKTLKIPKTKKENGQFEIFFCKIRTLQIFNFVLTRYL